MNQTLITLVIVVPLTALTAWWNMQIRFAENKEEAIKMWKTNVGRMWNTFVFGIQIWIFLSEVFSEKPLTRIAVGNMIFTASMTVLFASTLLLLRIADSVSKHLNIAGKHWNVTE